MTELALEEANQIVKELVKFKIAGGPQTTPGYTVNPIVLVAPEEKAMASLALSLALIRKYLVAIGNV